MTDTPTPVLTTLRDSLRRRSPRWLQGGNAEKVLYSIGVHLDALVDAAVLAVKFRFPNLVTAETLPLIGRERRIARGPSNTDAVYANRLRTWRQDHRKRGGPISLLNQLGAYYDHLFAIDLYYVPSLTRDARRFALSVGGVITWTLDAAWTAYFNASLDGNELRRGRWWLKYAWPSTVSNDGTWGSGGTWDDGGVWDSGLTPAQVADLLVVPTEWNTAHAHGMIILDDGVNKAFVAVP